MQEEVNQESDESDEHEQVAKQEANEDIDMLFGAAPSQRLYQSPAKKDRVASKESSPKMEQRAPEPVVQ